MTRQQAINYLSNSGFSMIQVETIVKALSTLSEVDFQELKHRYGDEVEYVVRDMISGENLRWVELPRPKKQEPFINKPCVSSGVCEHDKQKVLDKIRAEIEQLDTKRIEIHRTYHTIEREVIQKDRVLEILDKYKAESEGKE